MFMQTGNTDFGSLYLIREAMPISVAIKKEVFN